jgi:DNA invertase Pin-like site-specific DNA recombinase
MCPLSDRPELQRLAQLHRRAGSRYVIVHKVDRLAHNRYDDAIIITERLQAADACLIRRHREHRSDANRLQLHGIMSSIAEF